MLNKKLAKLASDLLELKTFSVHDRTLEGTRVAGRALSATLVPGDQLWESQLKQRPRAPTQMRLDKGFT